MMCKRLFAFVLLACLCFVSSLYTRADETGSGGTTGDILLVYDDELTEQAHENVASIADILTYLGYNVSYRRVKESTEIIKNFSYIVFYHDNDRINPEFLYALEQVDSKIMVVGGGAVAELLQRLRLPAAATIVENASANIAYSFDGEKEITTLVHVQKGKLLEGDFSYRSGTVLTNGKSAAFCVRTGRFCSIAVYDGGNAVLKAMLTQQIALWKWPYEDLPHSYAQYIVFDEVYPFFDTGKMMKVIDLMKETGIPYAITVMPIYQNGEYPAMKRFCEVLRYAQAHGAAIVLKAPIINAGVPDEKEINKRINIAFSCYSSYGVYPIAIEAPNNWMYEPLGQAVLRRFRTVILTPDPQKSSWSEDDKNNTIYADGHQLIAPALSSGGNTSLISLHPAAVFLNMLSDLEDLRGQLLQIRESSVPLKSLWSSSHVVYTDDKLLSYKDGVLTFQGKTVSLEFIPSEYEVSYKFNRGIIGRITENFAREDRKLLVAVSAISILFIVFIAIARYQNRKRFLYKPEKRKHSGKGGEE